MDEAKVTRNAGAKPGDALVLTKPLGIGVTVRAGRIDSAAGSEVGSARKLSDAALEEAVTSCARSTALRSRRWRGSTSTPRPT